MNIISAIVSSVGPLSLLGMLLILAQFGRKLGAVTHMRPYYRGYYGAIALLGLALVMRLVRASVFWAPPGEIPELLNSALFYLVLYHIPLALGLTLGLGLTWYYWSWLLKER
jgi:hypothetical protein